MDRRRFSRMLAQMGVASTIFSGGFEFREARAESNKLLRLDSQPLRSFAFGSCNFSYLNQGFWQNIGRNSPDLWISLGDNIYGDGHTMESRRALYQALKNDFFYAGFRSNTPVIGIWDDHDYASDNMGYDFPDKAESKQLLIDFLDIDARSGIYDHDGVYQSYSFGPKGRRTKVVLLDTRYHMDRSKQEPTLLGMNQWVWLREEIAAADYDLLVVGTSISVSSEAVGWGLEGWKTFELERHQLFEVFESVECPILVLSGDRHQADIAEIVLKNGKRVFEFMSSGLTHGSPIGFPNQHRISKLVTKRNFGLVSIDWQGPRPNLKLSIKDPHSSKVYEEKALIA